MKIDLEHLEDRAVALPLPAGGYTALAAGKEGTLYLLEDGGRFQGERGQTLTRFVLKTKKSEKLADHVAGFDLSFDGDKMLLEMAHGESEGPQAAVVRRQRLSLFPPMRPSNPAKANWICPRWKSAWIRAPSGGRCFTRYGRSSAASSTIRTITGWTRLRQKRNTSHIWTRWARAAI